MLKHFVLLLLKFWCNFYVMYILYVILNFFMMSGSFV